MSVIYTLEQFKARSRHDVVELAGFAERYCNTG
jgi:hypothetical protein